MSQAVTFLSQPSLHSERFDISAECGRGWDGRKGSCVRAKAKTAGKVAKHQGIHLAENVAAWKAGKVIGGAIAASATAHGANPEAAKLLGETAIQALAATALSLRDPAKRKPKVIASTFVTQAGAAFVGKASHGGMESAATSLGASQKVEGIAALISGKVGGIGTSVGLARSGTSDRAAQWLASRGKVLKSFYARSTPKGARTDSVITTEDLNNALYELSVYALLKSANDGDLGAARQKRADTAAVAASGTCGKGWRGPRKGDCVRAKRQLVREGTKQAIKDDAVNVSTWAAGKIVGGAISSAAQAHGLSNPPAQLLAESATQALLTVGLAARKKSMGAAGIAKGYVTEVAALMATKHEPAWDDGVRGGSEEVRMMIEVVTSRAAPAQAKALYRSSAATVARLVRGRKLRLDGDDGGLTTAERDALLLLATVGMALANRKATSEQRTDYGIKCGGAYINHKKKCSRESSPVARYENLTIKEAARRLTDRRREAGKRPVKWTRAQIKAEIAEMKGGRSAGRNRGQKLQQQEEGRAMGANVRARIAAQNDPRGKGVLPAQPVALPREIDHSPRKQGAVLRRVEKRRGKKERPEDIAVKARIAARARAIQKSSSKSKYFAMKGDQLREQLQARGLRLTAGSGKTTKRKTNAEMARTLEMSDKAAAKRQAPNDADAVVQAERLIGSRVKSSRQAQKILKRHRSSIKALSKPTYVSIDKAEARTRGHPQPA